MNIPPWIDIRNAKLLSKRHDVLGNLRKYIIKEGKNVRDILIFIVGDVGSAILVAYIKTVNLLSHLHPTGFYCPLSSDTI